MKFRIYAATSALGGCEDEDFAGVLMAKMRADAQHIVNLPRIHGCNSVNLRQGYPMIEIRTPREVMSDE